MNFRKQALRKLEAPEQLDQAVRLASAPAWLLAAVLSAAVVAAGTWASVGTVARTVHANGVLIHSNGVSDLDATVSGQVQKVWAQPNRLIAAGAPLYSVQSATGALQTVASPWDAYVVGILVSEGEMIQPGHQIASLERIDTPGDALNAVVFVPAASAPMLRAGMSTSITAEAASPAVFGTLSGLIQSVGAFPETAESLRAFLGSGFNTAPILADGSAVRVVVKLAIAPNSNGGLLWSRSVPPFQLNSESAVSASFTVAKEHPMSWVLGR